MLLLWRAILSVSMCFSCCDAVSFSPVMRNDKIHGLFTRSFISMHALYATIEFPAGSAPEPHENKHAVSSGIWSPTH